MRIVIVLDGHNIEKLADFWAEALDYQRVDASEPYAALVPKEWSGPNLLLQRVDEPKAGKNRMHVDLRVDDHIAERDRLVALGATVISDEIEEFGYRWFVMSDPEGNEFCVIKDPH